MGLKRKQPPTYGQPNSKKRVKAVDSSPHPHGDINPERLYKIRGITDERPREYRVDWADDEETGEHFEPTWEPKANVTKAAIAEWRAQKSQKLRDQARSAAASSPVPVAEPRHRSKAPPPETPAPQPKRKGRPKKVIDSSPEVSPKLTRSQRQVQQLPPRTEPPDSAALAVEPEPEPEIVESQQTNGSGDTADSPLFEPAVELSEPPSSYRAGEYQKFSSSSQALPTSDAAPSASAAGERSTGEQSRSVPVNFGDGPTRVIPDSQTLIDFSSSAPAAPTTSSHSEPQRSSGGEEAAAETPALLASSAPAVPSGEQPSPTKAQSLQTDTQVQTIAAASSAEPPQPDAAINAEAQGHQSSLNIAGLVPEPTQVTAEEPASHARATASRAVAHDAASGTEAEHTITTSTSVQDYRNTAPKQVASPVDRVLKASRVDAGVEEQHPLPQTTSDHSVPRPSVDDEGENGSAPSPAGSLRTGGRLPAGNGAPTSFQRPLTLSTSTTPSSFPFQTQIAPLGSGGIVNTAFRTGSPIRLFSALSGRASSLPPASNSTPLRYSSPIASAPPYSIGTIGESAPPHPGSPASQLSVETTHSANRTMEASPASTDSKMSLSAKLKAIREQRSTSRAGSILTSVPGQDSKPSQASLDASIPSLTQPPRLVSSLIAEDQARRSPSAVPAMEPQPEITRDEMNTSERYETLYPHAQENGLQRMGSVSGASLSRQQTRVEDPQLSHSFVIPIALVGHQRDQYSATVRKPENSSLIQRFLAASAPDAQLSSEMQALVDRIRNITMHPDLDNGATMTQYEVEPKAQAEWDTRCSAKCHFLKDLLGKLRDQALHIAIIAQPGHIIDILDTFLTGISVPHRQSRDATSNSLASENQGLMVTLVSVEDEVVGPQPSPADLVIAMDPTVSVECMPIKSFMRGDRRPPITTLVVPYSVEHIEQSVSTALNGHARIRTLASGLWQYHQDAGRLEDGQLKLEAAARALAEYLATPDDGVKEWPLPTLAALENLDSQTESEIELPDTADEQGLDVRIGNKRPLDLDGLIDEGHEAPKKARTEADEMLITINPQDLDVTRISDSVTKPTQAEANSAEFGVVLVLSEAEQTLQRLLQETQLRLEEHVQALSDLQYRYEEQRQQLVSVTVQREYANESARKAVERMTVTEARVALLRTERNDLQQRLEQSNARLLEHAMPERAELERVRLAAEQAQAEKLLLEKRLETTARDLDYLRSNYQTASQSAQSLASQVTGLENSLAVAQNKAAGEQSKLRQMGYDAQTKNLRNENQKLKAILQDREAALKFRDDEISKLKEASRGRMGTRGTSVPRSPRLGSPMKMDGGVRGRLSRQGSPAAGELRGKAAHLHPLRNG